MVSPQSIQQALGGDVRGNSVHLPTDGHSKQDRGTVVTVDPSAPDGILVHSFNGGDPLAVKDRLRGAGLLPPLATKASPEPRARWQETGCYVYDDGDNQPLYRVKRLEAPGQKKRFVAERLEGGAWVNGLGDIDRLPYRFTALCEAGERQRAGGEPETIFFVEGERKADKLADWGLLATCIVSGSSGWREEYGECFSEARVVILPDNDSVGMKFAETVKAGIENFGGVAVILELPGLPDKGDIIDWQGDAAQLVELANKALAGDALPMRTLDLAALAKVAPKAKPFAIERVAPVGEVTLFTGPGSAGKSLLGQQIATCAAASIPCLGLNVMAGPAIYVSCEDDEDQLHWRQSCICDALCVSMASLGGKLHLASLRGELDNQLGTFDADGSLKPSSAFHKLSRMMQATGAGIVLLDNVAHLFTGNENDRGEVTRFVNLLNRLASTTGAAILLIGHPNKAGADYSGSTAWLNAVRSQVFLSHDVQTDVRTLTVSKANYTQKGEALRFLWLDGAFVREDELPPDRLAELQATSKAASENDAFLQCLRQRQIEGEGRLVGPSPGPNYAPSQFEGMTQAKGHSRAALKQAMERLFTLGLIESHTYRNKTKGRDVTIIREVK